MQNWNSPIDSAIDFNGVIHSIWTEASGRVMTSSKPPAGPWTAPVPLPDPPAHNGGTARIVVDSTGTVHAVWVALQGLYYSQKRSGAGWSPSENIPGAISSWYAPELAVAENGSVKVAYVGPGDGAGYGDAFFTERRPNGTWTPLREILRRYVRT